MSMCDFETPSKAPAVSINKNFILIAQYWLVPRKGFGCDLLLH